MVSAAACRQVLQVSLELTAAKKTRRCNTDSAAAGRQVRQAVAGVGCKQIVRLRHQGGARPAMGRYSHVQGVGVPNPRHPCCLLLRCNLGNAAQPEQATCQRSSQTGGTAGGAI